MRLCNFCWDLGCHDSAQRYIGYTLLNLMSNPLLNKHEFELVPNRIQVAQIKSHKNVVIPNKHNKTCRASNGRNVTRRISQPLWRDESNLIDLVSVSLRARYKRPTTNEHLSVERPFFICSQMCQCQVIFSIVSYDLWCHDIQKQQHQGISLIGLAYPLISPAVGDPVRHMTHVKPIILS